MIESLKFGQLFIDYKVTMGEDSTKGALSSIHITKHSYPQVGPLGRGVVSEVIVRWLKGGEREEVVEGAFVVLIDFNKRKTFYSRSSSSRC